MSWKEMADIAWVTVAGIVLFCEPSKLSEEELSEIAARWPGDDPDLTSWQDSDVETLIENGRICLAELAAKDEEIRRLREAMEPFAELGAFHRGYSDVKHLASVPVKWLCRAAKAMETQTTKPKDA